MVLRTLYLPLDTDLQLKALAFTRDVSKGELMRELIVKGLKTIAASELGFVEHLTARLGPTKCRTRRLSGDRRPARDGRDARDLLAADRRRLRYPSCANRSA